MLYEMPLWLSILPPLTAIILALLFREVISSIFAGILVGCLIMGYYSNGIIGIFSGFFDSIQIYIMGALYDSDHLAIITFSTIIGGMVAIVSKNGGMDGLVNIIKSFAKTRKSAQFSTWLLGVAIFFDDYANTLVVGNTMRPLTDKLKISREKLSYLVDSTAAPVASIAFVTTWIGAELSYIQDGISSLGLNENPYSVFINSIQYSFYPILSLIFILFIIFSNRDFGPMFKAEQKTQNNKFELNNYLNNNSEFEPKENIKSRSYNAIIPVLTVVIGTFIGLLITGISSTDSTLLNQSNLINKASLIIGNSNPYSAMLWSSLASLFISILLSVSQKILSIKESIESMINGFKTMLTPVIILILAWALALVTKNMHTAEFITNIFLKTNIEYWLLPSITFILSAIVAFSTGSSWGTMAILYPLMLPASWLVCKESGLNELDSLSIFHQVVSSVLAGSVMGDHCSPISDTTIMSSLSSSCDHIAHVKTQLPYALTVGVISILFGLIPAALGIPTIICFVFSIISFYLIIKFFGKKHSINS